MTVHAEQPKWRRILGKSVSVIVGLAVLALFLAWMGGAFHKKVAPGIVERSKKEIGSRTRVPVEKLRSEEVITAVASVQPRRKTDVAAQVIARVLEVRVQPGDRVNNGDVLVLLDDRELLAQQREALASVTAAEADVDLRRRERDRLLKAGESTSKEERDRAESALKVAEAQLVRTREQVSRLEVLLSYTKIRSASGGVVADRFADPGDLAIPGKSLLVVQDTRELELHASVPESQALSIAVGQELAFRIEAANFERVGRVREIVPVAQQASRSVLIKVSLPVDLSAPVYAGMFGRVSIPVGRAERLLVPPSAVQRVGQLELVEVVRDDGILERRFVRTGRTVRGRVEILSGLREGESVALAK